jgi:hypothetical protein
MFRLVSFLGIAALTLVAAAVTASRGAGEPAGRNENDSNADACRPRVPVPECLLSFHAPFSVN